MIENIKHYLGIIFIGFMILLISFFYFVMIIDLFTVINNNTLKKGKIIKISVGSNVANKSDVGYIYIIEFKDKKINSSSHNYYNVGDEVLFYKRSFNNAIIMYYNGKKMRNKYTAFEYMEMFFASLLTIIFIIIIKNKIK